MPIRNLFLGIISVLLFWGASAQTQKARSVTKVLCSDTLYGRGYVKDGVNKAARFLAHQFKASGLHPFLEDSSYLQPFTHSVNTFPDTVALTVNNRALKTGEDFIVASTSGAGVAETKAVYLDTSVVTDKERLRRAIQEVRSDRANTFFVDLNGADPKTENRLIRELQGLAKVGHVIFTTNQKFTWSVGRYQYDHAIMIVKASKVEFEDAIEFHIDAEFKEDFTSQNVIGYLPAAENDANTIVFTAHYDHLGGMGTNESTYFPGANDNASGTAMLISLADHFVKNPCDYNLLFIAFAGEEAGLLGSKYFVENTSMDFEDIHFLLNLDIMGSGENGITAVNGKVHTDAFDKLKSLNDDHLTTIKARGETANSDHYYFHKKGVPSFFIYTMGENKHYHDVHDTYDELTFSAYEDIITLLSKFVKHINELN